MTAFQPGSPAYEAMIAERNELRAEIERLRVLECSVTWDGKSILDLAADVERLRAALQAMTDDTPDVDCAPNLYKRRQLPMSARGWATEIMGRLHLTILNWDGYTTQDVLTEMVEAIMNEASRALEKKP